MENKNIIRKSMAILLALIMIMGSVISAYASTGTVTSRRHIILGGGSSTWSFTVTDSVGTMDGTCIEPHNQTIPAGGQSADFELLSNTSSLAKLAYLGSQEFSSDVQQYAVGRAGAYLRGEISYNNYIHHDVVNSLVSRSQNITVPNGFEAYIVRPTNGSQQILAWRYKPEGKAWVKKVTASNNHLVNLCPEQYSLAGAEFWIYDSYDNAIAKGNTGYLGKVTTDTNGESGYITLNEGSYYVIEGVAPKGYALDLEPKQFTVSSGDVTVVTIEDEPKFDPLRLKLKKQAEDGVDKNLSLEGAEYTVKYYKEYLNENEVLNATPFRTWVFSTDKNGEIRIRDKWKIGGDELFKEDDGTPVGLKGTYTFEETKAPKGFARTEGLISLQYVTEDNSNTGITLLKDVTDIEKTQKVELKLHKKDAETNKAEAQGYGSLAGAKYKVYKVDPMESEDTEVGEITTDEKGEGVLSNLEVGVYKVKEVLASAGYLIEDTWHTITARIKEPNTAVFTYDVNSLEIPTTVLIKKTTQDNTGVITELAGAKLQLLDSTGKVIDTWVSEKIGKIFKALPVGKYTIKEIEAPKGYYPIENEYNFEVKADKTIQVHEIFDEPVPTIKTYASFDKGVKSSLPVKDSKVIDQVVYGNVLKGHPYTYKGQLVDVNNHNTVIAITEVTFTPEEVNGTVDIHFNFDSTNLEGKTLVAIGELHRNDKAATKVADHKDLTDKEQTVSIPKIRTTATDKVDNGKDMFAGKKQTIIDKVAYNNLLVGKEYTVKGKLMVQDTNKPLLIDNKEVTAEKTFTAAKPDGFVELEFTFDASALNGKKTVVFEDIYEKGIKVGTHSDITDKGQTITFPEITTLAASQEDGTKSVLPVKNVTVRDTISYKNLEQNGKYQLDSQLLHKKTGEVLAQNEVCFKAADVTGEVVSDLFFDASELAGEDVVAYQTLYKLNDEGEKVKVVAEHKDINDKGQTVNVEKPNICTTATFADGKKVNTVNKEMTIIDQVEYKNLVVGKSYTIRGKLMDKSTNKPLIIDGKDVTAEKTFIATKPNGYEAIEFTFNGSNLGKKEVVVFEDLYYKDQKIATHTDITDVGQTVKIIEKGRIVAKFGGGNFVSTGDDSMLIGLSLVLAGSIISFVFLKRKNIKR